MNDHARHARPVFGCALCIEERDCWICACGDLRLPSSSYCRACRRRRPRRPGPAGELGTGDRSKAGERASFPTETVGATGAGFSPASGRAR